MTASVDTVYNSKILVVDSNGNYKQLFPETQPGNVVNLANWIHENAASIIVDNAVTYANNGATLIIPTNTLAIETDTGKMKVGNGTDVWNDLDYTTVTANRLGTARILDGISFDGSQNVSRYVVCDSLANEPAKTVSVTNFSLVAGSRVYVKFANANTANNPTLNVSNTGAKSIIGKAGLAISANLLRADSIYCFMYNGTAYEIVGGGISESMTLTNIINGDPSTDMSVSPKTLYDAFNVMMAPVYNTKADWYSDNPIVRAGVMAVESDTGKVKIGDGVTRYANLGYMSYTINISAIDELLQGY